MTFTQKWRVIWLEFKNNKWLHIIRIILTILLATSLYLIRAKLILPSLEEGVTKWDVLIGVGVIVLYFLLDLCLKSIELLKKTDTFYKTTKVSIFHELRDMFHDQLKSDAKFRLRLYEEDEDENGKFLKVTLNTGEKKNATTTFRVDKDSFDRCKGVVGKAWYKAHFPKSKHTPRVSRSKEVTDELISNPKELKKVMKDYNMSEQEIRDRLKNKPNDEYRFPRRMVGMGFKLNNGKVFVFMFDISNKLSAARLPGEKIEHDLLLIHCRILASLMNH